MAPVDVVETAAAVISELPDLEATEEETGVAPPGTGIGRSKETGATAGARRDPTTGGITGPVMADRTLGTTGVTPRAEDPTERVTGRKEEAGAAGSPAGSPTEEGRRGPTTAARGTPGESPARRDPTDHTAATRLTRGPRLRREESSGPAWSSRRWMSPGTEPELLARMDLRVRLR